MPDDLTAALKEIKERNEHHIAALKLTEWSVTNSPYGDLRKAVAALETVLNLADELSHLKAVPPSGKEDEAAALGLRWCGVKFREAIARELSGDGGGGDGS